jgi:hypothetical protein
MRLRRNWKRVRARSIQEAMELCIDYALDVHRRKVPEIATLMGLASHFTLYKWIESGRLPAVMIRPFEHACGCTFITEFLGASAHKLVIDIPCGRKATEMDVSTLQASFADASGHLIRFHQGEATADETIASLTEVLCGLAYHCENVARLAEPELDLFSSEATE